MSGTAGPLIIPLIAADGATSTVTLASVPITTPTTASFQALTIGGGGYVTGIDIASMGQHAQSIADLRYAKHLGRIHQRTLRTSRIVRLHDESVSV